MGYKPSLISAPSSSSVSLVEGGSEDLGVTSMLPVGEVCRVVIWFAVVNLLRIFLSEMASGRQSRAYIVFQ